MSRPQDIVPVPPKMRLLPRDRRGYPIPWIVQRDLTGRPFFIVNDTEKTTACGRRKVCGICGRKLERDAWMIGGPGSAFHEQGMFLDPPMHYECAAYALKVCPYIGARYTGRLEEALSRQGKWPANLRLVITESAIPEQPPFFALARASRVAWALGSDGAPVFRPHRPWIGVEFWRWGGQISEAEARERLAADQRSPDWTAETLAWWPRPAGAA